MPWRASPLVYGSTSGANGYGLALHDHGLVHEPRLVRSHLHVPRYCRWAPLAHTQLQPSTLDPVNSRVSTTTPDTGTLHLIQPHNPPGVSSVLTRHAATATKQPASSLPCLDSFGPLNHSTRVPIPSITVPNVQVRPFYQAPNRRPRRDFFLPAPSSPSRDDHAGVKTSPFLFSDLLFYTW